MTSPVERANAASLLSIEDAVEVFVRGFCFMRSGKRPRLYPHPGYRRLGVLQIFSPVRR